MAAGGDPSTAQSAAWFFVSRVDTDVGVASRRPAPRTHRYLGGRASVAQAKLAYQRCRDRFSVHAGNDALPAGCQRPLWDSTSTKNPAYPDTRNVDSMFGLDTVTTLPEATIAVFEDQGRLARTIDVNVAEAVDTMRRLGGVDIDDVGLALETERVW